MVWLIAWFSWRSVRALQDPGQQTAHEVEVAAVRNAREVLVEFVQRRSREAGRHGAGVLDGPGALEEAAHPGDGGCGPRCAWPRQKLGELPALIVAAVAQRVNDHQRPFAFQEIAVDLLAVRRARFEVEEVVLDLERGAVEESQAYERIERQAPPRADQAADAERIDRAEPARLLQHHPEVVLIGQIGAVVALPAELERLAFGALPGHTLGLLEDAQRGREAEPVDVVLQRAQAQQPHGIAGV